MQALPKLLDILNQMTIVVLVEEFCIRECVTLSEMEEFYHTVRAIMQKAIDFREYH